MNCRALHRQLFALALLLGSLLCSSVSVTHAQYADVRHVFERLEVYGLDAEKAEEVRAAFPIKPGGELTSLAVIVFEQNLRDAGFDLNAFDTTVKDGNPSNRSDVRNHRVVADFRPSPIIEEIEVFPLVELDPTRVLEVLRLSPGDRYDESEMIKVVERVNRELDFAGVEPRRVKLRRFYLDAEDKNADGIAKPAQVQRIALGFFIEPISPPEANNIKFFNAGVGNATKIRDFLKTYDKRPYDEGTTVTAQVLQDVEKISREIMRAQGFIEARSRLSRTEVTDQGLNVEFTFERGKRYSLRTGEFAGRVYPDPEFWEDSISRFDNRKFTSNRLSDLEKSLQRKSARHGYMAPDLNMEVVPDFKEKTVTVSAAIDEGTTSVVGRVIINRPQPRRGYGDSFYHKRIAPPLQQSVADRQVIAKPGDALNFQVVESVNKRFRRLGIFDRVNVDTQPTSTSLVRDIVAEIREKRTAELGASLGWNEELGGLVRFGFSERNVGGRSDVFSFGGYFGFDGDSFGGDVSYFDRYWETGEKLVGKDREPSMLYSASYGFRPADEYIERRAGGRMRFTHIIGDPYDYWTNSWQLRVEQIDYDPFGSADDYEEDFNSYLATTIAYSISYDTRYRDDNEMLRGFLFDTSVEVGDTDGFLLKWLNRAEYHRPLTRRLAWNTTGQVGVMPIDAQDIGISDRFQLGGTNSVRGFRFRGIGPLDNRNDELHIGGSTLAALQNELSIRLSDEVELPLFIDLGTIGADPFSFGPLRASYGLGLRVEMDAVQQAYFYLSDTLLSEDGDDERRVHFGVRFGL